MKREAVGLPTTIDLTVIKDLQSEVRKLTKIYQSVPTETSPEALKIFRNARKIFQVFTGNLEDWIFKQIIPHMNSKNDNYWQDRIRKSGWNFSTSLYSLFPEAYDYITDKHLDSPERLGRERDKRIRKYQAAFRDFVEDMVSYLESEGGTIERSPLTEQLTMAGMNIVIHSFNKRKDDDHIRDYLNDLDRQVGLITKAGYAHVLRGLIVHLRFDQEGLIGGSYSKEKDELIIYSLGMFPNAETLVHELGHRLYYRFLPSNARAHWDEVMSTQQLKITEEDLQKFVELYPNPDGGYVPAKDLRAYYKAKVTDTELAAKLNYLTHHIPSYTQSKTEMLEHFKKFEIGTPVMLESITEYGDTSPIEAFAEAFQLYVLKGPNALGPWTKSFFQKVSNTKMATIKKAGDQHKAQIALMRFLSQVANRYGVGEHVYVVGGAVRNFVLGMPIKDLDVVVDSLALKGKDSEWFAKALQREIPAATDIVTNQYGVAILTVKGQWDLAGIDLTGEVIEIANARTESYGGGGKGYKPDQVDPATIEQDVYRREFTFNTLLWKLKDLATGPEKAEIIDLTGCGLRDLQNMEMRCPKDPDIVFADDPTRMLRAIKFVAKYGFKIPPDLALSIQKNAPKMKAAPWEAIANIFIDNVLNEPTAPQALILMKRLGLLDAVSEMITEQKPFRAFMVRQLRGRNVALLLQLLGLGLTDPTPLSFLTPAQQNRLRDITFSMPMDEADLFAATLEKPAVDNEGFIQSFKLQGKDRSLPVQYARQALLDEPYLAGSAKDLNEKVGAMLKLSRTWGPLL